MHKKITERKLREGLKVSLVFFPESGEKLMGNFRVYRAIADNDDYCTEALDFLFGVLIRRKDEIH